MAKRVPSKNPLQTPASAIQIQPALIWGMWLLLGALAFWRVLLAASILENSTLPNMLGITVVQWPRVETFLPWIAIALLILARGLVPASVRQARAGILLAIAAAGGVVFAGIAVVLDQWASAEGLSVALGGTAILLLAGCALAAALLEVRSILQAMQRGGATILDTWRFAAAQWGLLMAAALVYMTVAIRKDRLLVEDQFRNLIFLLPAAGVLPNAMMATGILWWDRTVRAGGQVLPVPRVRAWMVAFICVNFGALLLVWRGSWLGIPGSILEILGIVFYLVGFPRPFWRGTAGKAVMTAWALLAVALGALGIERVLMVHTPAISIFYSAAWRHLWFGAVVFWMFATGAVVVRELGPTLRNTRLAKVVLGLMLTGIVVAAAVWLLTAGKSGVDQVPVMEWLIAGVLLEFAGVLAGAALIFRALKQRV